MQQNVITMCFNFYCILFLLFALLALYNLYNWLNKKKEKIMATKEKLTSPEVENQEVETQESVENVVCGSNSA